MRRDEMAPEAADGDDSLLTVVFFDRISPNVSLARFQADIMEMARANGWALVRLNGRAVDINTLAWGWSCHAQMLTRRGTLRMIAHCHAPTMQAWFKRQQYGLQGDHKLKVDVTRRHAYTEGARQWGPISPTERAVSRDLRAQASRGRSPRHSPSPRQTSPALDQPCLDPCSRTRPQLAGRAQFCCFFCFFAPLSACPAEGGSMRSFAAYD